ncbi:magnesium/cobalt transporter CorA [Lentiprolixibacter aurantiacus]|uniref:Magnesium transport protein CorA n=1 Tax=Lentiprolixibacter aurantiacus TaxID=2993939 RepID=A0AAE3SPL0_9FLAO|nr:magnesium/cobalt transporter CorA [Lentiprolixibacter aurantiacus]MCX2720346.1 magnesium/cobalt transporter CorA [Lentiprolixibacter aurantiacus]
MAAKKKIKTPPRIRKKRLSAKATIGQVPGVPVYVGHKTESELSIEVIEYNKGMLEERHLSSIEEAYPFVESEPVSWININGLSHTSVIEKIGKRYGIHPLVVEDIVNTQQRPKVEEFQDHLFVVVKMLHMDEEKGLIVEHLSLVLGSHYVISFQEAEGDVFDPVRTRLRGDKGVIRSMRSDYLLYALMDAVVDYYFHLLDEIGNRIESLEDQLFEDQTSEEMPTEIQSLKREILRIRRAISPLREIVSRIEKSGHPNISEKIMLYLSDLQDHIIQVSESIEIYREMTWSLMDMYMTAISNKMNTIMKVLTIIATIFIPLTFIAGIYGMNFEYIPELKYRNGYFILLGIMLLIFLAMLYYFRRKKWL